MEDLRCPQHMAQFEWQHTNVSLAVRALPRKACAFAPRESDSLTITALIATRNLAQIDVVLKT